MADRDYSKVGNVADPTGSGTAQSSFLENLEESAKNFGGNLVSAATHPLDTVSNIHDLVHGYVNKIPGASHITSGSDENKARQAAMADAMTKHFTERYGNLDKIKHTAYTDPVGFAADVSSVVAPFSGGVGVAGDVADAAGLTRTAATLGKVGDVGDAVAAYTNPLNLTKGATKVASMVADVAGASPDVVAAAGAPASTAAVNMARKLYATSLHPTRATAKQIAQLSETGLREGVGPADEAGLWNKIMGHADNVRTMVQQGAKQGLTIDPEQIRTGVADKLLPSAAAGGEPGESFGVQATPSADRARVNAALDDWTDQHFTPAQPATPGTPGTTLYGASGQPVQVGGTPGTPAVPAKPIPIPIDDANAIKSGTYKQLSRKAFGKSAAGAAEPVPVASEQAQLEIARGLRSQIGDELDKAGIPGIHGENAAEGRLLDLQPHIERNAATAAKGSVMNRATKGALVNHMLPRVAMGLYKAGKMDLPTLNYIVKQSAVGVGQQEDANANQ